MASAMDNPVSVVQTNSQTQDPAENSISFLGPSTYTLCSKYSQLCKSMDSLNYYCRCPKQCHSSFSPIHLLLLPSLLHLFFMSSYFDFYHHITLSRNLSRCFPHTHQPWSNLALICQFHELSNGCKDSQFLMVLRILFSFSTVVALLPNPGLETTMMQTYTKCIL